MYPVNLEELEIDHSLISQAFRGKVFHNRDQVNKRIAKKDST